MRIAILGVGSLGGVVVGSLADSDAELVCVSRGRTAELLESGLTLFTPEGTVEMIPGERYQLVDSEEGPLKNDLIDSCEVAIIVGKSGSTSSLSSIAEEMLSKNGVALSIQNGLGNAGIVASRIGWDRVLAGSTTHSAFRDSDGGVHWTGRGSIILGNMNGNNPGKISLKFISMLENCGLNPQWSVEIEREIWKKLMLNAAINPICSITGIKNGALAEIPDLWNMALETMREVEAVAESSGIDLTEVDNEELLREVIASTADNRVSMLQDLMAGRKTEIDEICGVVVSKGEELGIPTPRNKILHALIMGIEMSRFFD